MTFMDVTHPDDYGISRAVHEWLLEGHTRLIVSKRFVTQDGDVVPATVNMELVHDSLGHPRYLRSWQADAGEDWGAASAGPRVRTYSDVCVVREGFVAEPVDQDAAGRSRHARRVGRLELPPELL